MKLRGWGGRGRCAAGGGDRGCGRWRGGLAAVAVLAVLAAAGCSGSPPPSRGGGQPGAAGLAAGGGAGESGSGGRVLAGRRGGLSVLAGMSARSGVAGGALFGGDLPLVPEAGRLGRRLAIVRSYFTLGEQFPVAKARAAMQAGSTVLASLDSAPGQGQGNYASIAAGQHDVTIMRFLQQMERAAVSYHLGAIYFSFEHEANTPPHRVLGTAAQFVQAWDHVHALAASAHLLWNQGGRLHFVLILTHLAYFTLEGRPAWADSLGQASSFFPGTNEVDIVAADGYNTGGCRTSSQPATMVASDAPAVTPQSLFAPVVSFARSHGLPVFIAEWASVAYAGSAKQADFIAQMQAFVTANPQIAAAMYWNSRDPRNPGCLMSLDNQPASLAALATMGRSAALQGHIAHPGQT